MSHHDERRRIRSEIHSHNEQEMGRRVFSVIEKGLANKWHGLSHSDTAGIRKFLTAVLEEIGQ